MIIYQIAHEDHERIMNHGIIIIILICLNPNETKIKFAMFISQNMKSIDYQ